jgi:hypothetical protein
MSDPQEEAKLAKFGLNSKSVHSCSEEELLGVSEPTNVEGMYDLATLTLKNANTSKTSKALIWNLSLDSAIVPIILNNSGTNYFLLISQSRFAFGGKVSIEVNRGFMDRKTNIDRGLLWSYLIDRKVPYLKDLANVVKVQNFGDYLQHPDISIYKMPVQLVFAKTLQDMDVAELKKSLKVKHDYYNEPKSGPPLHNTQPVLKSIEEVENRLDEIMLNGDATSTEYYLNDVFSYTAVNLALKYIKFNGLPF